MDFPKPWGNYLLEKIVDTPAPETISFMPQTLAWKIIAGIFVLFICKKIYNAWKTYKINAYRREALAWLEQCSLENDEDVKQLPALLRKTALLAHTAYLQNISVLQNKENIQMTVQASKTAINALHGELWVTWLDKNCNKTNFTDKTQTYTCELLLCQLAYLPKISPQYVQVNNNDFSEDDLQIGVKRLKQQIAQWIKFHQLNFIASSEGKEKVDSEQNKAQQKLGVTHD
ncbi:DUF4381 domain-containing protein [Colwellia echini]|uniref:DUF4381 domain-containing protein n=1 Tax=Colwellia echini TaxID=1982103 RepID=A0ABY3MUF8_9GAMM|nr:DUF4381 domain-containing protein [Colwellia echini]TYK64853.1 DUF4381 domain-containing protein [Colwellia echini]